ncbi:MAG TPA: hypothetical protein VIA18_21945 [Polyangia bacterium]|nr:hypothetical protein [Polyangia bacterium]
MGMHFGILAVRAPLAALTDRLAPFGVGLGDELTRDEDLPEELVAGEHAGQSYVVDPLFDLSAHGDFVRQLSAELQTMVVGCGAETVSGTFWVFAAENGRALRSYWSCAFDLATAFDEGDWCRDLDLESRDGEGMFTLLRRAGFDYETFFADAPKRTLESPLEALRLPNGALHERLERHRDTNRLPEDVRSAPPLDVRDFPGALLDFDLTPHGQPEPLPPLVAHVVPSPRRDPEPQPDDAFVDVGHDVASLPARRPSRAFWYVVAVGCALTWLALRFWWSAS